VKKVHIGHLSDAELSSIGEQLHLWSNRILQSHE